MPKLVTIKQTCDIETETIKNTIRMEENEVVVVYDYTAQLPDELTLKVGDVITHVERLEGGWWRGTLGLMTGMFPDNFVKVSKI